LPACILVFPGYRVGEYGKGNWSESAEAGKALFLVLGGGTLFLFDGLQAADGGDDVAGFGFFAACDWGACWGLGRRCFWFG